MDPKRSVFGQIPHAAPDAFCPGPGVSDEPTSFSYPREACRHLAASLDWASLPPHGKQKTRPWQGRRGRGLTRQGSEPSEIHGGGEPRAIREGQVPLVPGHPGKLSLFLWLLTFLWPPGVRGDRPRLSLLLEVTETSSCQSELRMPALEYDPLSHMPPSGTSRQPSLESRDRCVCPEGQRARCRNRNIVHQKLTFGPRHRGRLFK